MPPVRSAVSSRLRLVPAVGGDDLEEVEVEVEEFEEFEEEEEEDVAVGTSSVHNILSSFKRSIAFLCAF